MVLYDLSVLVSDDEKCYIDASGIVNAEGEITYGNQSGSQKDQLPNNLVEMHGYYSKLVESLLRMSEPDKLIFKFEYLPRKL